MSSGFHRMGCNVTPIPGINRVSDNVIAGFNRLGGAVVSTTPPVIFRSDIREQLLHGDSPLSPRAMGFTGDTCTNCGGIRMRNNGTCQVCSDCGTTTGCS